MPCIGPYRDKRRVAKVYKEVMKTLKSLNIQDCKPINFVESNNKYRKRYNRELYAVIAELVWQQECEDF